MESGTQAPNEKIRSEQAKQKAPEKKSDSNDYLCPYEANLAELTK